MAVEYRPRLVDEHIEGLLGELSALFVVGPRGTGKTTTALRHAKSIVRLDDPIQAQIFNDDANVGLRGLPEPIVIDEWQLVPNVLSAIKRAVDTDPRPGRFIVTGSVRGDTNSPTWPGTGRLTRVPVHGMTIREQQGKITKPSLIDRIVDGDIPQTVEESPDIFQYVELALRSGFPDAALSKSDAAREQWLESYVDQLLTRDVAELDQRRDPQLLRRYFETLASTTAGTPNDRTLYQAAGINNETASAYDRLFANLLVVDNVPAWSTNRLKRLVSTQKRYLIDAGLVSGTLRVDAASVIRNGDMLGRVIDTFVASQLRAELATSTSRPRLYHLRQQQGRHEVDLIAEVRAQRVVAFEVKSSSAPDKSSGAHLEWLRDALGDQFVAGVVLHTGPRPYALGTRIHALPISALWS